MKCWAFIVNVTFPKCLKYTSHAAQNFDKIQINKVRGDDFLRPLHFAVFWLISIYFSKKRQSKQMSLQNLSFYEWILESAPFCKLFYISLHFQTIHRSPWLVPSFEKAQNSTTYCQACPVNKVVTRPFCEASVCMNASP